MLFRCVFSQVFSLLAQDAPALAMLGMYLRLPKALLTPQQPSTSFPWIFCHLSVQRIIKRSQIKVAEETSSLLQYYFVSRVLALLFSTPQKFLATVRPMNDIFYFAFQVVLSRNTSLPFSHSITSQNRIFREIYGIFYMHSLFLTQSNKFPFSHT